jgi:uncharacterized protein (TIGR03437 family)
MRVPVLVSVAIVLGTVVCPAAESDALAISANIQARHTPYGTVIDPIFASATSNTIVGYTRCADSAIWTGHYLAAESFRYRVTQDPLALANIQKAVAGIKSLVDITGTDVLARCLIPINSPYAAGISSEEAANGIYTNKSAGYIWVGNTSRDEYCGVMLGLATAYDLVDDATVKASAAALVTRLLNFLIGHAWTIVLPDFSISDTFIGREDQVLAFLQIGSYVNPGQYAAQYASNLPLAAEMIVPIGLEVTSLSSYFKFNLDYINLYSLIRLQTGPYPAAYDASYALLRNATASHQNAHFNMIDRALHGGNAASDAAILSLLDQWLLRPSRDPYVDLSNAVAVCGGQACQPIPVPLRVPTDFLWQRTPFQLSGGGSGTIETAGIDYILPYWMSRYYGVGQALTVQSAAAGIPQVAPDSLASCYGSNLVSQPAKPTTLTVQDSAGVTRNAQLLYVGANQINFVIPHGTAPGAATVTVANGGTTLTGTATIQSVAPSVFSASGSGMGVAAATAVSTQVANPALQGPVPVVQCSSAGCVSVPIALGVDTPVYLSLYGTGIRGESALANVSVTINGISVPVTYAGAQPAYAGLDQVNVLLTLNLRGSGPSNVMLTVDGQTANVVMVNIQ